MATRLLRLSGDDGAAIRPTAELARLCLTDLPGPAPALVSPRADQLVARAEQQLTMPAS